MEVGILRRILTKAVEWGEAQENPARNVRPLREPRKSDRYLSDADYERLEAECPAWLRPVVALAATTGMRQGELLRLRWKDVDRKARLIDVRETKTGEPRSVPIFRDAAASVNADPSYGKLSEEYEREAKAAFEDVPLTYDTDGDGFDDEATKRVATSIVMLNRPPRWGRY